jgi:mono/diheme cytochrome c family protein
VKPEATLLAVVLGSGLFVLTGQQPAPIRVFTSAQADAGRAAYENTCGKCHTPTLLGRKGDPGELPPAGSLSASYREFIGPRGFVAPLTGKSFIDRWGAKTAAQLIARFQETVVSFPPEGMNDETTVDITAYVLQVNGAKAGNRPLTRTTDAIVRSITR